jgi:CHAD domain-containing protein/HD superfamily phosphodiesterase
MKGNGHADSDFRWDWRSQPATAKITGRLFYASESLVISNTLSTSARTVSQTVGLRYWMTRVLEECDNVAVDFSPDPVHDLRVSLRRCRSLADGLMALDPDPNWKAMKKAGKHLFQRLGDLRDVHVMEEWAEKLDPARGSAENHIRNGETVSAEIDSALIASDSERFAGEDPTEALRKLLTLREEEHKREAKAAVEEFDRKQWRHWSKSLPSRAARFRLGSALFKHLALERWTQARELHRRAMRNRSQTALHALRIGIKRFRYIVENFLPAEHEAWGTDLKEMQDLLGEVHDLDVLWGTAISSHIFYDAQTRTAWHERIRRERMERIERYRAKTIGPDSLWSIWRTALPQGKQIEILAMRRMKLWASGLDPDFRHSERVAGFALQLYDGLLASSWRPAVNAASARASLLAAALLHDVGKSKGDKGHHKSSLELIRRHPVPLGCNEGDLQRASVVARFHCGALPSRKHKLLRDLLPDEEKAVIQLAAILRLANSFDAAHDGRILRLQLRHLPNKFVELKHTMRQQPMNGFPRKAATLAANQPLTIAAEGYTPLGPSAQAIAAERHLLETVLRRPVIVKPMKHAASARVH